MIATQSMTRSSLASTLAVGIALAAGAAWGGETADRVEATVDQEPKSGASRPTAR